MFGLSIFWLVVLVCVCDKLLPQLETDNLLVAGDGKCVVAAAPLSGRRLSLAAAAIKLFSFTTFSALLSNIYIFFRRPLFTFARLFLERGQFRARSAYLIRSRCCCCCCCFCSCRLRSLRAEASGFCLGAGGKLCAERLLSRSVSIGDQCERVPAAAPCK